MDFLKSLFENGAITWEQFSEGVTKGGFKIADLSKGDYVGKQKYEDAISTRDTTISELNNQIKTRDKDIKTLQTQLADGNKDSETKVADLTAQLEKLQGDYTNAKTDYEKRLATQSYEFAVKEYSATKKFTSSAAKREFERAMIAENLKVKDNTIIGADDFMKVYQEKNADSFVTENDNQQQPPQQQGDNKPMFGQPTPPQQQNTNSPFENAFNFIGVRKHE